MRISDWSSDVCSSDLVGERGELAAQAGRHALALPLADARLVVGPHRRRQDVRPGADVGEAVVVTGHRGGDVRARAGPREQPAGDRKSVVQGTSVAVRVGPGGRRTLKKKNRTPP